MNKITITAADNSAFEAWVFPAESPKATVHILHGMAEHCLRYSDFAEFLQQHDYQVLLHNHRGHGGRLPIGHFADQQEASMSGWELVIDDILRVQETACGPEPLILFGHSMGSFIAQACALRYGNRFKGLILSGSNRQPATLVHTGLLTARSMRIFKGGRHLSETMNQLSFGQFNSHFHPNRTEFDWLSRDKTQVDAYIHDPYCGHLCSLQLWCDLLGGLKEINNPHNLKKIPSSLPVLIFGGEQDPVGNMGKGLQALEQHYRNTGHQQVTLKLYAEGRHEMLNEINSGEVATDLLYWINNL